MVKTVSSKISDPRPRIALTLQSDDEHTVANVTRGFVNVQRGVKTAILRIPYGELAGIIELLDAADRELQKHGYDTAAGSEEPVDAPADATTTEPTPAAVDAPAAEPAVETVATTGTPATTTDNPFSGLQSNTPAAS